MIRHKSSSATLAAKLALLGTQPTPTRATNHHVVLEVTMKFTFALVRIATLVAVLISSFVNPDMVQSASKVRNNKYFTSTASQRSEARSETIYPFEFHSGFWINLHHFLYEQALLRKQAAGQTANSPTNLKSQLSSEEQQQWDSAVDHYMKTMIKRDLLRDEGMMLINDQLGKSEAAPNLSKSGLSGDLIKILEGVAPIYRAHWWPQHDRANRFWIAVVKPMVQQFSQTLIKQLTTAYKAKWPTDLIRVDVVEYANWAGAYTTFDSADKVHITMSTDSGNQGFSALELLFHESSHWMVGPNDGAVAQAIARECKAKAKPIPNGLWHAIIFYTAGEFTRQDLNEYGVSDYKPYAYRGLYERAWPNLQRPLELYWQPYLEGTVDFDKAISNLINAL
jgi:hypothetical protein